MIYFLFIVFIVAKILDLLATKIYCLLQKKKDRKYGICSKDKPQYTYDEVDSYSFPKKQIKSVCHIYKGWIRYKLIQLGKIPSHTIRNFFLRNIYLMQMDKTAVLYGGFEIRDPWKIIIKEGAVIGDECKLDGRNGLIIGRYVNFSTAVWCWTEQHDLNDPYFYSGDKGGTVIIGDRAWVSSRVTVLPKVNIGEGCVIASGAVVTKDCEAFGIYGGIPAKKIGERIRELKYKFNGKHEAFW